VSTGRRGDPSHMRGANFSERRLGEVRSQTLSPGPNGPASRNTPGHRADPTGLATRWSWHLRQKRSLLIRIATHNRHQRGDVAL
jgi:hypothetical protein